MKEYFFDDIDIKKENINIPSGTVPFNQIDHFCKEYEKKIEEYGGIDIQILGVGGDGHKGFNEATS